MTISTTRNLSTLAELMGTAYTEADAADFAAWLLDSGHEDTDDISDRRWVDLLDAWEDDARSNIEVMNAWDYLAPTDRPGIIAEYGITAETTSEDVERIADAICVQAARDGIYVSRIAVCLVLEEMIDKLAA